MGETDPEKVVISTELGYAFDASGTVEGAPVVVGDGVEVTRELAEQIRAEARSLGVRVHVRAVKKEADK